MFEIEITINFTTICIFYFATIYILFYNKFSKRKASTKIAEYPATYLHLVE